MTYSHLILTALVPFMKLWRILVWHAIMVLDLDRKVFSAVNPLAITEHTSGRLRLLALGWLMRRGIKCGSILAIVGNSYRGVGASKVGKLSNSLSIFGWPIIPKTDFTMKSCRLFNYMYHDNYAGFVPAASSMSEKHSWRICFKLVWSVMTNQITRFMGSTWGPSGADRTQVGPMLAPWTLLSGKCEHHTLLFRI